MNQYKEFLIQVWQLQLSTAHADVSRMDPRMAAGRLAERQMKFYLDEAFRRTPGVMTFNDVSFEDEGIRHQIDHLVLHTNSLFIVESKSVSTEVEVNERGEWSRRWNGLHGMASPVEQAKRQATALRTFLNDRSESLSTTGRPNRFADMPIAPLVAISDRGRWTPKGKTASALPVLKADLISAKITTEIGRHEQASRIFGKTDGSYGVFKLNPKSFELIASLLRKLSDSPQVTTPEGCVYLETSSPLHAAKEVNQKPPAHNTSAFVCSKCHCEKGQAHDGRYGPYFRCANCEKNNAAPRTCSVCESKLVWRLSNDSLRAECVNCNSVVDLAAKPNAETH